MRTWILLELFGVGEDATSDSGVRLFKLSERGGRESQKAVSSENPPQRLLHHSADRCSTLRSYGWPCT